MDSFNGFLTKNVLISREIYRMDILIPELAQSAQPGQFVMLGVNQGHDPFLKRPLGLADIQKEKGTISLIYQNVGRGTALMSKWEPGHSIDIIGPLGQGFSWQEEPGPVIIAGGGMGIAPLLPLAATFKSLGKEVYFFLGARSKDLVFGIKELGKIGCQARLATEDGSLGVKGFVTKPLEDFLQKHPPRTFQGIFACGPTPFLQAVAQLCHKYNVSGQLSLEERMGCGIGACMGCTVETKDQRGNSVLKRVCHDGPVFAAEEVVFNG